MLRKTVILLFFYILHTNAFGQQSTTQFYFNHLKVEDGLTQSTVWCILQDKTGFIWLGTKDGLNRFDGYKFKTFRYDPQKPETSLGNNFVRTLYEDQNGKIWVGTNIGIYIYDPTTEKFSFFDCKTEDGTQIDKEVNDIQTDKLGNIWIGNWQGVFKYNTLSKQLIHFKHDPKSSTSLSSNQVWCICIDSDNIIWVGTLNGGLNRYQSSTNDFITYSVGENGQEGEIYSIMESDTHSLLLGTKDRGVLSLNRISGKITPYIQDPEQPMYVRSIIRINEKELWIGTESGLYVYNTDNQSFKKITQNLADSYSLSSNAIYSIYKDREGGIWIGTYFGGINYLPSSYSFEKQYPISGTNSISGNAVREFQEDQNGNLWIGTEDAGLTYFIPETKQFHKCKFQEELKYHNIHGLLLDGDSLWIGYFSQGMDLVNLKTGKVEHFTSLSSGGELSDNNVFSIYKDRNNNIWIGTTYGLNILSPDNNKIRQVQEIGKEVFVYDIIEDSQGIMWFATYNDGIFCYNPRIKKWENIRNEKDNPESLGYDKIIGLYEDSRKWMWLSTEGGGASVYLPTEKKFKTYTTNEGLPNNVVYKILEDEKGNIWMTTNKGLSCLDIKANKIKTYKHKNGLLSDQFNYKSGIKTHNGRLYFGSINGFINFDPNEINTNTSIPPIVLTGFQIFNEETEVGEKSPLKQSIVFSKKIELTHEQSSFSFDFAALSYNASETNQYAYKLENFDKSWIYQPQNQRVSYSNIPPGKYIFKVVGANNDGIWNKEGLAVEIIVRPPFWASTTGICLWIFMIGVLSYYIISTYRKKLKLKSIQQIEKLEITKEKAIYKAKIDFFTNIAHEIRTPLSLIMGPYKQILKEDLSPQDYNENLEIMGSNINRLLNLTNQFLDFKKVENQGFALNFVPVNINEVVNSILYQFKSVFKLKNIEVKTNLPQPPIIALADSEVLTKIFSNLINNASKFAKEIVIIELCTEIPNEGFFSFKIRNDGKRIDSENRELIFDTFFQEKNDNVNGGSGLGLPLVKHLASLHQGKVYVDPSDTQYNCFIVEFPILKNIPIETKDNKELDINESYGKENNQNESLKEDNTPDKPQILIVEDDAEMCLFLKKLLSKYYITFHANDGIGALKILERECIDLVLSDVIMPNMDGFELCRYHCCPIKI